ncbi:polysaccharide deacetylase lipoprotein [Escherichia coli]|nr:polysaccharide deacetylase lipoprotein [Escherichia coli]
MLFTASVSAALPARYMQTIENAAVWAQIGDKMVTVGNIRAGQIIAVEPTAASYYAFNFGFGKVLSIKVISSRFRGDKKLKTVWATSTSR